MNPRFKQLSLVCLFSAVAFPAVLIAQQPQSWSTVGSTGIPDESSGNLISFSDTGSVFIKSGIASATAQIRYPVSPAPVLPGVANPATFCLDVNYRDTGTGSRVIVSLRSVDGEEGTNTHLTFDSDAFQPTGDQYLFNHVCGAKNSDGSDMFFFHTLARAFYIDVRLIKSASSGNPGVKKIMIAPSDIF
jgi:hypothetical protein